MQTFRDILAQASVGDGLLSLESLVRAGCAVVLLALSALKLVKPLRVGLAWGLGLVTAVVFVAFALQRAWLADDAFISFRYARNLAAGQGLVWNTGDRIEGYTNFLWTVVLAAGERVGLAAPNAALLLNLGTVVIFVIVASAVVARRRLAIAPALIALNPGFLEFGTSGLESAPAALAVAWAALAVGGRRPERAAVPLVIAALLRPDHSLFFAPLLLVGLLMRSRRAITATALGAAAFGVYWLWRWWYFSALFPNTFHAKSGGGSYFGQGGVYVFEAAIATGVGLSLCLLVLTSLTALAVKRWRTTGSPRPKSRGSRAQNGHQPLRGRRARLALFAISGSALYGLYIARVGGDFMEFRFALTLIALLVLVLEPMVVALTQPWGRATQAVTLGLVVLPLCFAPRLIGDGEKRWFIARESSFYRLTSLQPLKVASPYFRIAEVLARAEKTHHLPPLAAGCVGMIGYLTRLDIIDTYGLTNRRVAAKPITSRGRPGHEKVATPLDLLEEGAVWSIDPVWAEPLASATRFVLEDVPFWAVSDVERLRTELGAGPSPEAIAAAISTRADAFTGAEAMQALLAGSAGLSGWLQRWGIVDATTLETGGTLQGTSRRLTGATQAWLRPRTCEAGRSLRWQTQAGTCDADHFSCASPPERVGCVGPHIELTDFHWVVEPLAARLRLAEMNGPVELAAALEDEGQALPAAMRLLVEEFEGVRVPGAVSGQGLVVTEGAVASQQPVGGYRGRRLLNTFAQGDAATGSTRLLVQVKPGTRLLVSALVGGGSDCSSVFVRVVTGGVEQARACGRNDETVRRWASWVTAQDDALVIEVVDGSAAGWGHLLVDSLNVSTLEP